MIQKIKNTDGKIKSKFRTSVKISNETLLSLRILKAQGNFKTYEDLILNLLEKVK